MAKIKKKDRYPEDVVITDNDYLIGTDADESNRTKNFPIKSIADYIASKANADTSFIQNNKVVELDALDGLNQQEPVISQAVNLSTNFTINGDEIFFINNQFSSRGTATTLSTYRNTYIFKKGKGNYGLNSGLELVEEDFLLIRSVLLSSVPLNGGLPPRVEYIESTDITDPSSTVNTSSDSYDILNNRDTYFVVQSFLKETPRPTIIYRFVGIVGSYGLGGTATVEADFLLVEDLSDINSFDPVILSNTSQLENDGANGSDPFITENDLPESTAATTSLDPTNFIVAPEIELQAFAERVDHQMLKSAGTGVNSSYTASVAIAGTTFTIGAVQGEISSDEGYFDRHYGGDSGVELVNASAPYTYVYIDKNLVLQQQVTTPTEQDWNRYIFVMRIVVDINTNLILGFGYYSNPIGHYGNTIRTLWKYLLANGVPFRIGQEVTGSTTDLSFDIAAGTLMVYGSTGNINAPHEKEFDLVESTDFTLIYRTTIGASVTQLPKVWDSNGTITPLGSTTCVAHRIYRYSTGDVVLAIGQANYANMVLCKAGALLEQYVLNPLLKDAVFMGWWLIEETATSTSGTVDAEFVEYTIGIQGGSSSGLAGALLRGNNLSDILDPVVAKVNLQLQVQDAINTTTSLTIGSNGVRTFCNSGANIEITIDHLTLANNHETLFINKSNFEVTFIASVSSSTFVDASSGLVLKPDGMAYLIRAASANEIYLKISN
jgi:hypothetical protein